MRGTQDDRVSEADAQGMEARVRGRGSGNPRGFGERNVRMGDKGAGGRHDDGSECIGAGVDLGRRTVVDRRGKGGAPDKNEGNEKRSDGETHDDIEVIGLVENLLREKGGFSN